MDENEMLEVTEADADARRDLAGRMAPLHGGHAAQWLATAVKNGSRAIHQVRRGTVVVGVFWGWFSVPDETYVINAAGSLVKFDILSDLIEAMEATARIKGAKAIRFETARRGLVKKTSALGYVAEGVVMSKRL